MIWILHFPMKGKLFEILGDFIGGGLGIRGGLGISVEYSSRSRSRSRSSPRNRVELEN